MEANAASGVVLSQQSREDGTKIAVIKGDGYESVTVTQASDSPDPRVAGTKIIFDSRMDKF